MSIKSAILSYSSSHLFSSFQFCQHVSQFVSEIYDFPFTIFGPYYAGDASLFVRWLGLRGGCLPSCTRFPILAGVKWKTNFHELKVHERHDVSAQRNLKRNVMSLRDFSLHDNV